MRCGGGKGGTGGVSKTPAPPRPSTPSPPHRWCSSDIYHIDLSYWAFEKLAHPLYGVMNVDFRPVDCYDHTPLPLTPGHISRTIYSNTPEPGWAFNTFKPAEQSIMKAGAAHDGGAGACASVLPSGGVSWTCRRCTDGGYQPFNGASAISFWAKPVKNIGSTGKLNFKIMLVGRGESFCFFFVAFFFPGPPSLSSPPGLARAQSVLRRYHLPRVPVVRERERRRGEGRAPTADRHARAHLNPTPSPPRYKEEAGEHKKYVIPIDDFNCGRQGLNNVNSLIFVNGDGGSETALCLDHIEIIGGGPFQSQPQIPAMPEGGGRLPGWARRAQRQAYG